MITPTQTSLENLTLSEAELAACRPVASIIADGRDGYLCHDAEQIAARIRGLVDHPSVADDLGRAGYAKATASYTWDAIGARVHDLYADLSHRGAGIPLED